MERAESRNGEPKRDKREQRPEASKSRRAPCRGCTGGREAQGKVRGVGVLYKCGVRGGELSSSKRSVSVTSLRRSFSRIPHGATHGTLVLSYGAPCSSCPHENKKRLLYLPSPLLRRPPEEPSRQRDSRCFRPLWEARDRTSLSLSLSSSRICCLPLCYPQRAKPKITVPRSSCPRLQPATQQLQGLLPGPPASRTMIQGTAEAREHRRSPATQSIISPPLMGPTRAAQPWNTRPRHVAWKIVLCPDTRAEQTAS
ncbi:uncharacterized protein LOC143211144 [Lasioglossum baleicum]|uniref:uncharacterized protein LOC143211144 n=1 Tax=Lasioglossum baleicum TaxID=434251 RepID=UPI003FCDE74B